MCTFMTIQNIYNVVQKVSFCRNCTRNTQHIFSLVTVGVIKTFKRLKVALF